MSRLRKRDVTAAVFVHDVEHVPDFRYDRLELLGFVRARNVFVLFRLLDRTFDLQPQSRSGMLEIDRPAGLKIQE